MTMGTTYNSGLHTSGLAIWETGTQEPWVFFVFVCFFATEHILK